MSTITISRNLVLCYASPNGGVNLTICRLLGDMLQEAEKRYGPRDQRWTILGVEFHQGVPCTQYTPYPFNVLVQIGEECLTDPWRAYGQLAMEVPHLLFPVQPPATNLEEGVTVCFAEAYTEQYLSPGKPFRPAPNETHYIRAGELVKKLLSQDPNAVKQLRQSQPNMSLIREQDIQTVCPWMDSKDAQSLASPFGTFVEP